MDDDLADQWTTMDPVRDHACTAIGVAAEAAKESTHRGALRFPVGLKEGWESLLSERRSAARSERAATDEAGQN